MPSLALTLGVLVTAGLPAYAGKPVVRVAGTWAVTPAVGVAVVPLAASTQPAASAEVQTLQQAYAKLAVADHDYKGHRVKAMKHIAAAAKVLGSKLSGDGKDKEKQTLSDADLNQVKGMLQQVQNTATANKQKKVAKHMQQAIKEINIALTIR